MKKLFVAIILILVIVFGILFFMTDTFKPTETLSEREASKLANESYLDILVALESYNVDTVEDYKLLEVAMRIAREIDLVETKMDPVYLEFVPRETIHAIIYELTGKEINKPIVEEDFYYLYDEDNDYYYIVPLGTDWIHYGKIKSAEQKGSSYQINCTGIKSDFEGSSYVAYEDMKVSLQKKKDYKYVKYFLSSIETSQRITENESVDADVETKDSGFTEIVDEQVACYSFSQADYDKVVMLNFLSDDLDSILGGLVNYYANNKDAYRNTRVVISVENDVGLAQGVVERFNPDVIICFNSQSRVSMGSAALAEIFEEELGIEYGGDFDELSYDAFEKWSNENGIETLLVGVPDGENALNKLISALDKII